MQKTHNILKYFNKKKNVQSERWDFHFFVFYLIDFGLGDTKRN